jgi:hypothetical protein
MCLVIKSYKNVLNHHYVLEITSYLTWLGLFELLRYDCYLDLLLHYAIRVRVSDTSMWKGYCDIESFVSHTETWLYIINPK